MQGQPDRSLRAAYSACGQHLRLCAREQPDGLDLSEDLTRNGQQPKAALSSRIDPGGPLRQISCDALFQAYRQDELSEDFLIKISPPVRYGKKCPGGCAPRAASEH